MKLYINTAFDARESLVVSQTENTLTSVPTLFNGDSLPLEILFVDGVGEVDWRYKTQHVQNVKVALGDLDQQTIVAYVENLTMHSSNFWQGQLVLHTEALANQLIGSEEKQFHFEVQVVKTSGEIVTAHQSLVSVRNQLILNADVSLKNSSDFYVLDPNATLNAGQDIRILTDFTMDGRDFQTNESFTIAGVSSSNSVKVIINSVAYWIGQRGVRFEVIAEVDEVTQPPVLDPYATLAEGQQIKILKDVTINGYDFTKDQTFTSTGYSIDSNSTKITIDSVDYWIGQRGINFEVISDPADVSPPPDTDGDGLDDASEYFINSSAHTQTKAELDSYSLDPHRTPVVGDIVRILTEISTNYSKDSYSYIYSIQTSSPTFQMRNVNGYTSYFNDGSHLRGRNWEIVNPTTDLTDPPPAPPSYDSSFIGRWVEVTNDQYRTDDLQNGDVVQINMISDDGENLRKDNSFFPSSSEGTNWIFTTEPVAQPYFVYGDDGTNGVGFYYPVYLTSDYLNAYHTHTIDGVVYYMEDADANHAVGQLPSDTTLTPAPNTSIPIPPKFQVGDSTTWYDMAVTIIEVNDDGTYDIDTNTDGDADATNIQESALNTDINGNQYSGTWTPLYSVGQQLTIYNEQVTITEVLVNYLYNVDYVNRAGGLSNVHESLLS